MKQPPENHGHPCLKLPAPSARSKHFRIAFVTDLPVLTGSALGLACENISHPNAHHRTSRITFARTFRKHSFSNIFKHFASKCISSYEPKITQSAFLLTCPYCRGLQCTGLQKFYLQICQLKQTQIIIFQIFQFIIVIQP